MRKRGTMPMTPRMKETLRELMKGEQLICCGRPTKQRLVKWGLAVYKPMDPLDALLNPWDREIEITDKGRKAVQP